MVPDRVGSDEALFKLRVEVRWDILLAERAILRLTDSLARDRQFPADLFERFLLSAVETKTLRNNFLLPIVDERTF